MVNKLEPGDKLLAGMVLIVIGLVGLVYRFPGYGVVIGDLKGGHVFYGGSNSILALFISVLFIIVTALGIYIVYDTVKKDRESDGL